MSAMGQKRTFAVQNGMSALPPIADIRRLGCNVRLVPLPRLAPARNLFRKNGGSRALTMNSPWLPGKPCRLLSSTF